MSQERVTKRALLDSGATESFIHPRLAKELAITTYWLEKPRQVQNVDGTSNWLERVTQEVKFQVFHESHCQTHRFLIANIREDDIILGYLFFEAANPVIDWPTGKVHGAVVLIEIWPTPVSDTQTESLCRVIETVKKTNVAQQLAIEVLDKQEKTWQELVPKQYHKFGSVFSEKDSERFPGTRKWDHAIDLKADALTSIDCCIYPLAPKEKEEQREFLVENLQLHRICRSNSPYASGFFLIRKKDGKFRPVQDYRNLNKWTIPNWYPLPLINDLIYDLAGYRLFSKFDVRWGYNNICIKKGDEWKAAFKTSEGLFKPTVMFFGLTNCYASLQRFTDRYWFGCFAKDQLVLFQANLSTRRV